MSTNVVCYLEQSARDYSGKTALLDGSVRLAYEETLSLSRRIGTDLSHLTSPKKPVGVYMEKEAKTLYVFFGAVYAGCFYSCLNTELPANRLGQIVSVLEPGIIVTTEALLGEHVALAYAVKANTFILEE